MKKILFVVAGLVLSAGLYAQASQKNCKSLDNFWVTIDGNRYVVNGNLCLVKDAKDAVPVQQYIVDHAGSGYVPANIGLTLDGKTSFFNGFLEIKKAGEVYVEGTTLKEALKNLYDQLVNGKATTSGFKPIDSK